MQAVSKTPRCPPALAETEQAMSTTVERVKVKRIAIAICEPCLKGEGEMCTTPSCALFLHKVGLPFTEGIYEVLEEFDSL